MNNLIFFWIVSTFFVSYLGKKRNEKWKFLAPVIMLFPLVWLRESSEIIFLVSIVIIAMGLLWGRVDHYSYSTISEEFKKSIVIMGIFLFLCAITNQLSLFNNFSAAYGLLYFVTTVMLLRSLRYMEYNGESSKINRINLRYAISVIFISFILSTQWVLSFFTKVLTVIKAYYDKAIISLFSGFFLFLGRIAESIYWFLYRATMKSGIEEQAPQVSGNVDALEMFEDLNYVPRVFQNQIFTNLLLIILILLIGYSIFRIYARKSRMEIIAEDYTESREFIFKERDQRYKLINRIKGYLKPKTNEEKIRQYYQKFLEACKAQRIELHKSDTSRDVNLKAQALYDPILLEEMRTIYLMVRYGECKIDTTTYNQFLGSYKKLLDKKN